MSPLRFEPIGHQAPAGAPLGWNAQEAVVARWVLLAGTPLYPLWGLFCQWWLPGAVVEDRLPCIDLEHENGRFSPWSWPILGG